MDPVLSTRRAAHAERHAAAAEKADAMQRIAELDARIDDLDADELDELERAGRIAHGTYSIASHALREKVRVRRSALTDPTTSSAETDANGDVIADDGRGPQTSDVDVIDEPATAAANVGNGNGDREQVAQ